jgi:hypothetical protein
VRVKGFTVLELFVVLGIFSIMLTVTSMLLKQSVWVWTSGDSREDASSILRKARSALARDLNHADLEPAKSGQLHFAQTQVPQSLGGGDAIWFLSPVDSNGEFAKDRDGYPFWQRNVLFYLAKPANHDEMFATSCLAGDDPGGDDFCPHKTLVRVVIDNPPVTEPLSPPSAGNPSPATPELLIPPEEISNYLMPPVGFDVPALQDKEGVESVQIVATRLLWFKVAPSPGAPQAGLEIDLRAAPLAEVSKQVAVGKTSLLEAPNTMRNLFSVFPKN